ncbi:hypothetical protein PIB30_057858 [Stylosanthes scabra]|uniref:Uncharacterized protein n=1 Tax=Stylosanthes scabra TaxID=79078 RepID=A0ABU6ZIF6_9FABA|nr:hypothetical protein [Stylosanthes scabra]
MARWRDDESRQQGMDVSRGEVWMMTHKKIDGSYIHQDAQVISEKIMDIEQHDESSRVLSQNDSLAQAVESEVELEKVKRQAMENALRYLIQKQGGNLPADIIAGMNSLKGKS